jgi:hypothetical protein
MGVARYRTNAQNTHGTNRTQILKYWISHFRTRLFWTIIVTYRQLSITTLLSFICERLNSQCTNL